MGSLRVRSVLRSLLPLLVVALLPGTLAAQEGALAGTVQAAESAAPLGSVQVQVLDAQGDVVAGALTSASGTYRVRAIPAGTYAVRFDLPGRATVRRPGVRIEAGSTTDLSVSMEPQAYELNPLTVSAARQQERLVDAPASVQVVGEEAVQSEPAVSSLDYVEGMAGINVIKSGLQQGYAVARGFNNVFSGSLLTLTDHRIARVPSLRANIPHLDPTTSLDIQRIEVVLGPGSALYGPNAHTGVVNVITKDPWDESGAALDVRGGGQSLLDLNGRFAGTINENFGWKVTGQYMQATDFKPPTGGPNAAAIDSTHFFGTPFNERELVEDYDIESIRAEGSLYYKFGDGWTATGSYGFSENDNFGLTNNGRNRILGWQVKYQNFQLSNEHWFAQVTHTSNDAGNTYQINGVADAATVALAGGASREQVLNQLPSLRDANRFVDRGQMWDSEIQYRNTLGMGGGTLDIVTGGQYRDFQPDSDGTFLADAGGEDISATEVGGYVQLDYRPSDQLRINAAARVDNHSNYGTQFSPKAAVVYTVAPSHNVRVGYNRAFKSPTVLESNLFIEVAGLGNVFRGNIDGYTVRSGPAADAPVANEVSPLDPEEVNSLEVGYKGVFGRRVFVDVVAYNSWYQNFISPLTNVANPAAGTFAFQDGSLVDGSGFLWTYFNFGEATVRGLDAGLNVYASDYLNFSASASLIDLADFEQGDAAQPLLLNVPGTKLKGSVTLKDAGFDGYFISLSGRWHSAYEFRSGYWDSAAFYSDGEVPSRFAADLTVGYTIPETGVSLKGSVSNLFDTDTVDVLGAPQTGRLIWVSATYKLNGLRF